MSAESNIALVRGVYAAFAAGDAAGALAAFAPDFVLREPESLPYGGTYTGLEELAGALPRISPYVDLSTLEVERVVGDEEVVVAFVRARWKREAEVEFRECFTVRNGKVAEMRVFAWDTVALVEGSSPD